MRTVHLPWLDVDANVREMTGVEEDLFLDRKKVEDGRSVNHTLMNCTESFGDSPDRPTYAQMLDLKTADRLALMLAIREESFGAEIESTMRCDNPECQKQIVLNGLRTDQAIMFPTTRESLLPDGEYTIALSDQRTTVTYRMLTGHDETRLAKASREELMTTVLLVPLAKVVVDQQVLQPNDWKRWLKALGARYRSELRDGIENHAFGFDTRFRVDCPECGSESTGMLEQLPGFFFPRKSAPMGSKPM